VHSSNPMSRDKAAWAALAATVVFGGCGDQPEQTAAPTLDVVVAAVVRRDVPVVVGAVGQTRGSETVEIRARVEGFVEKIAFREGAPVSSGDLLYLIDRRPFLAAVARARATVAQADAVQRRAELEEGRLKPLTETAAISRSEYDDALTNLQTSQANLDAARAALQTVEIDLGYTRITAPIAGIAGFTQVQAGNLVGRGENTLLTTISHVDPIWVRFAISEREYMEIYRRSLERTATSTGPNPTERASAPRAADAPGPAGRPENRIRMVLADGSEHPFPGTFRVADRAVDPTTGTLAVEVTFPNPDGVVRPGQFARVQVQTDVERNAILVLQRSVRELQGSYSVAVLGADDTLALRPVTLSRRVDSFYVISDGLTGDETVVVEGLQRARDGMKVRPRRVELGPDGRPFENGAVGAKVQDGTPTAAEGAGGHD
jgi:membrane fusion protein, multidrug efflux system